jgi:hypothetical protein
MIVKFVKSQKTGEWVPITEGDMDFNRPFAKTIEELTEERNAMTRRICITEPVFK